MKVTRVEVSNYGVELVVGDKGINFNDLHDHLSVFRRYKELESPESYKIVLDFMSSGVKVYECLYSFSSNEYLESITLSEMVDKY